MSALWLAALAHAAPWCEELAAAVAAEPLAAPAGARWLVAETAADGAIGPYLLAPLVDEGRPPDLADLEACAAARGWPALREPLPPGQRGWLAGAAWVVWAPEAGGDPERAGVIGAVPADPTRGGPREDPALTRVAREALAEIAVSYRDAGDMSPEVAAELATGGGLSMGCGEGECVVRLRAHGEGACFTASVAAAYAFGASLQRAERLRVECPWERMAAAIARDGGAWTAHARFARRTLPLDGAAVPLPARSPRPRELSATERGAFTPTEPAAWEEVLRHAAHTGPGTDPTGAQALALAVIAGLPTAPIRAAEWLTDVIDARGLVGRTDNPYTCLGLGLRGLAGAVREAEDTKRGRTVAVLCGASTQHQRAQIYTNVDRHGQITAVLGWMGEPLGLPWPVDADGAPASRVAMQLDPAEGVWKLATP